MIVCNFASTNPLLCFYFASTLPLLYLYLSSTIFSARKR